ncbi:hypothetical protein H2248_005746 [Termitomyces sp. 'cryptogamus']|nr:hypothetical protein H2248_005746 [Termitomyces sp. 'cryptogamus']
MDTIHCVGPDTAHHNMLGPGTIATISRTMHHCPCPSSYIVPAPLHIYIGLTVDSTLSHLYQTEASNSSAPSVMECVICHKWDGAKYSRADGNFTQWSEKLKDAMILNGIYAYVFDPFLSCPNSNTEPHAHANWNLNDCLAITFLRSALEDIEHCDLVMDKGARHCFEDLKT